MAASSESMTKQLSDLELTLLWLRKSQSMDNIPPEKKALILETGYQYISHLTKVRASGKSLDDQFSEYVKNGAEAYHNKVQPCAPENWDQSEKAREIASILNIG
jgi:hypothetical protein